MLVQWVARRLNDRKNYFKLWKMRKLLEHERIFDSDLKCSWKYNSVILSAPKKSCFRKSKERIRWVIAIQSDIKYAEGGNRAFIYKLLLMSMPRSGSHVNCDIRDYIAFNAEQKRDALSKAMRGEIFCWIHWIIVFSLASGFQWNLNLFSWEENSYSWQDKGKS